MNNKPSDFFIGVIDFFGILVPGATLILLQSHLIAPFAAEHLGGEFVAGLLGAKNGQIVFWISCILGSYVLGHLVLGLGVPINKLLLLGMPESKDPFYNAVQGRITLPNGVDKDRANAFHHAYCSLCLRSPSALAEVERQMADYKLFRSLAVVFAIDLMVQVSTPSERSWPRVLLSLILLLVTGIRFLFLIGWTYRTTFEFYSLLEKFPITGSDDQAATPNPGPQPDVTAGAVPRG